VTARLLLRGGIVLTLGARTQNHAVADVLIEDGRIAEVGPGLRARDAEVVDATDTVVMPGFVDAHRHVWKSLFRNLGVSGSTVDDLRVDHRPDDVYAATLVGLLGAIEAGITTVVDWSDIPAGDEYTKAALEAHADAGLRTIFVHAALPSIKAVRRMPAGPGRRDATSFAWGAGDPESHSLEAVVEDWAVARSRGLRIHAHTGRSASRPGVVSEMARRGLLGGDITLVHCSNLDDADLDAVASSGTSVALTPASEMSSGLGSPPMQRLIDRDIRPGLGVDDETVTPGDLFAQMRAAISIQHGVHFDLKLAGKGGLPNLMSTREAIRFATLDGAATAGLASETGSLEPGKQADIVVLRTDRPNVWPINDPIGAVVWGMDTSNVDWVFVAGHALMREGVLTADTVRAGDLAEAARRRVGTASSLLTTGERSL
jgi:cytosine/adenosine deaminase-related metal-dependent hydrolase